MFEEHLSGGLFVLFNGFFRIFLVEHITILPGSRNFIVEHNKILPRNLEIKKISQISWRTTHLYLLNRLKLDNYMKNPSCRTPPNLQGAKHLENTCFVHAARWLLSELFNCRLYVK